MKLYLILFCLLFSLSNNSTAQVSESDSVKSFLSNDLTDTVEVSDARKVKYKQVGFYNRRDALPAYLSSINSAQGVIIRNENNDILKIHEIRLAIKSIESDSVVLTLCELNENESIGLEIFKKKYGAKQLKSNKIDVSEEGLYFPLNGLFVALEPIQNNDFDTKRIVIRATDYGNEELTFQKVKGSWISRSKWRMEGQTVTNPRFGLLLEEPKN
jgi:hypothetical protein